MPRHSVPKDSSGEWASAGDTLRSTDSNPVPANRNDSPSSSHVDKAGTSSHATSQGSLVEETPIPTFLSPFPPAFPPPARPSKLEQPASLIGGSPAVPIYDVRTNELPETNAQTQSDNTDASQLPQLPPSMPGRPLSESQPNIQAQSIIPPIWQNTAVPAAIPTSSIAPQEPISQYSHSRESHPIPIPPSRPDIGILPSFSRMPPQHYPPQKLPSPMPQHNVPPLRQTADTPSVHYGTQSQSNGPQGVLALQLYSSSARPIAPQSALPQFYIFPNAQVPLHSASPRSYSLPSAPTPQTHSTYLGTPQQFVPQSASPQFYGLPNAPTPQAQPTYLVLPQGFVPQPHSPYVYTFPQAQPIHVGAPHPFISPIPASNIPSPQPPPNVPYPPVMRRVDPFVARDPFRLSYSYDQVDRPSDILTFDDITTPGSTPRLKSLSAGNSPYGPLPSRPASGEIPPLSLEANHSTAHQEFYPPSNVSGPQLSLTQPSRMPEPPNQHQMPISGQNDASEKNDIPTSSSSSLSIPEPQVQSPTPEPHMPSTPPSSTVESKSDGTSSNSREESQVETNESSRPYIPPHSEYSRPELPESIFSRLTRFFRWSYHNQSLGDPPPSTAASSPIKPNNDSWSEHKFMKFAIKFMWVTLPKQMYLYILLRLPALYFSRVAQIFEEARMALDDIKRMALEIPSQGLPYDYKVQMAFEPSSVSPAYKRLASTWEFFIDSLMREWKTFNIISVLLLTAILTILQIQGAAEDPVTRYTALFSLMCALMSLLFGCSYIIRFGSMRKPYKAAEWALEALKTKTLIWWNVWVLLAMPAIWLTWSILLYIACIMAFAWRSGVADTTHEISDRGLLAVRAVLTLILVIGMIYAFLVMTTFRRYGSAMDNKWKRRIDNWIKKKARKPPPFAQPTLDHPLYFPTPYVYPNGSTVYRFGDTQSRYPWDTYGPTSSDTYDPPPQPRWTFTPSPNSPSFSSEAPDDRTWDASTPAPAPHSHPSNTALYSTKSTNPLNSTWSTGDITQANTNFNAGHTPSPKITPPLPPTVFITSPGGTLPKPVPEESAFVAGTARKQAHLSVPPPPPPSLPPILGTPMNPPSNNNKVTRSSPKLKNKVGSDDDTPDQNRVRFRSPLVSGQESVNLVNKDMDKKAQGTPQDSSDIKSCPSDDPYLDYI